MPDTREQQAIDAVECPQCHAWPGADCFYQGRPTKWLNGRRYCHPERRKLHAEQKRAALARMAKPGKDIAPGEAGTKKQ